MLIVMTFKRLSQSVLLLAAMSLSATTAVWAQCAMCKTSIANAQNAGEVSSTVNAAVLVLLLPTLLLIGALARLVYKYRHSSHPQSIQPKSQVSNSSPYVHFRSTDA